MATFIRLVDSETKGRDLLAAATSWRDRGSVEIFERAPESFKPIPGSPFAYWTSDTIIRFFQALPALEGESRTARQGLATTDVFRFVRNWVEVDARETDRRWFAFGKGGAYSPYYGDLYLVVNWEDSGREIRALIVQKYPYLNGNPDFVAKNTEFYFRPGLTWTARTTRDISMRALPTGAVFSNSGHALFSEGDRPNDLLVLAGILNSAPAKYLLSLLVKAADGAARSYETGLLQRLPVPNIPAEASANLSALGRAAWSCVRSPYMSAQWSTTFVLPAVLHDAKGSLSESIEKAGYALSQTESRLEATLAEIDEQSLDLYGVSGGDRRLMSEGFGSFGQSEEASEQGSGDDSDEDATEGADRVAMTEALLEWTLGVALGRFDIRLATGDREPPLAPDPFDPVPVCSPGMLQNRNGMPAAEAPPEYPFQLPPHRILVDDPGHPWDVVARIEVVFDVIAGDRGHAWIQEAEEIVGRDLRDWLRRYGFERHLKRYSRSRRKAPLFWHLAPRSREYGIWLYSPVASRDTLYRIQNDYLEPKLKAAERRLLELRQSAGASPTGQQRKDLASQETLVEELRAFREQVARIAPLWKPYRDDGVVLNCAVLSGLFDHHRTWQKECAKKWGELAGGKYDWAGWAMHLWPSRVVAACASDRSIAIAHGLEEALWQEGENGKWEPRADAEPQVARLVAERRSPAVQAALDAFERAG
jgi:hypothetical protein